MKLTASAFGPASLWGFVALHACTPLKSSTDTESPDAGCVDPAGGAPAGSVCAHREPPQRPCVRDAGGTLDLVFAVSEQCKGIDSQDDAGRPLYKSIGFDLDHMCTGEGEGPSCVEPPIAALIDHRDGVDGIDNAYTQNAASNSLDSRPPDCTFGSTAYPEELIRVRFYSGTPDDDRVEVSRYYGYGLSPIPDGRTEPQWDGFDRWQVIPETLKDPGAGGTFSVDEPRHVDDSAYVTGGMLVAQFGEGFISAGLPSSPTFLVPLTQVVIVGRLVHVGPSDTQWELRDIVEAGRGPITSALVFWGHLALGDAGQAPCQDPMAYDGLKSNLCRYVDISSRPGSPPSAPCDALSVAAVLQARPALLGGIAPQALPLSMCAPGIHPETDTCNW